MAPRFRPVRVTSRAVVGAVLVALACGAPVVAAAAPASTFAATAPADDGQPHAARRVVLVIVRPDEVAAWRADPVLSRVLEGASVALLSTYTGHGGEGGEADARSALATLGEGTRRAASTERALARTLAAGGVSFVAEPSIAPLLGATPAPSPATPLPAAPAVVAVDARGDPARAQPALDALDSRDIAIVLSPVSSVERVDHAIRLGIVAFAGDPIPAGLALSPTTRRAGVVALVDVAPTIVRLLGLSPVIPMEGRVASFVPRREPVAALAALERDVVLASSARRPFTRGILVAPMVLVVVAVAAAGRRVPRPLRETLVVLLVAAGAAPLVTYVVGVLSLDRVLTLGLVAAAAAIGVAVVARVALGVVGALVAIAAATAVMPLLDLVAGTPLAYRSPLAFQIAGGGRFYGIDDGILGLVLGGAVVAIAAVLDRARGRGVAAAAAVLMAATVWVLAAPGYGSKFGAALTAVPAFGVLALRAAGRRLTLRAAAGIAALAVATTALFVLVDVVSSPSEQSHVARAVEGRTDLGDIVLRKIESTWRITVQTIWSRAALVFGGALAFLAYRRRALFERALGPVERAGVGAAAVAAVAGLAFNDGGVVTAALALLLPAVAAAVMVTGDPGPQAVSRTGDEAGARG